jgi:Tol biopolymer transport system component
MPVTDTSAARAELGRILASSVFVNSPRMSRFLRFVVETTLDGNGASIKEYVIALEVFEKAEDYDPQADSTVRTEASKLRSRLARYYETEGREDSVIIAVPKGSYVPKFEDRNHGAPVTSPEVSAPVTPQSTFPWLKASAILAGVALVIAGVTIWRSSSSPLPGPRLVPLTSYPEVEEQPSLSPDGSQVAFRWKGDIYVKSVSAEAVVQVTKDPAVDSWPAWSPDGSQIAFVRNGEVFLVSPLGGPDRKVAESSGRVAWMPDGLALLVLQKASAFGAQSVFRVSLATGQSQRLTFPKDTSFIGDVGMAVSPDGQTIAFCRTQIEGCDLFLMPTAGGEARRLTSDHKGILGFAWTADGREIVFASNRQGRFQLWRVAARPVDSAGLYASPALVEGAGDDARNPSISLTSKLAYEWYSRNFDIQRAEIIGAEGTATHHLGRPMPLIASTQLDATPSWSPDGKKIAFKSNRSGTQELWVCDADGSNPLKLTSFAGPSVIFPRWSPDGQRLIFGALTGPGGNFESYIIGARAGAPERIRAAGHRSMAHPVFSHDGRWIYFIPGAQDGAVEAFKMPAEGGEALQITRHGAFRPEESPDGKLLYYGKYGTSGLWSTPVPGGEERQVLDSITGMNWTVASEGIYYFDFAGEPGAPKLVRFYSFKTGKTSQVGTVEATVSIDYSGISVSPDGRWLLYSYIANISSDLMMVDHFR